MVLPRALASFNRHVTNRAASRIAARVPPFGIVLHKGRKSGRAYRTPVWVFEGDGVYRIALTYGRDSDWVKNVVAAHEFEVETKGHTVELADAVVAHDPSARWAPIGVRQALTTMSVEYYVEARPTA